MNINGKKELQTYVQNAINSIQKVKVPTFNNEIRLSGKFLDTAEQMKKDIEMIKSTLLKYNINIDTNVDIKIKGINFNDNVTLVIDEEIQKCLSDVGNVSIVQDDLVMPLNISEIGKELNETDEFALETKVKETPISLNTLYTKNAKANVSFLLNDALKNGNLLLVVYILILIISGAVYVLMRKKEKGVCAKCKGKVLEEDIFCVNCGYALKEKGFSNMPTSKKFAIIQAVIVIIIAILFMYIRLHKDNIGELKETTTEIATETTTERLSLKEQYKIKLQNLETEINNFDYSTDNSKIESYTNGIAKWDKMLNEIYSVLKNKLSKSEMDTLRINQRQWIKDRDAQAVADTYGLDGDAYAIEKNKSLMNTTKARCYEFIDSYM